MPSSIEEIGFFNPIYPSSSAQNQPTENLSWLGRIVEPYFDLGQTSYSILPGPVFENAVPIEEASWKGSASRIMGFALKVISYATLIIPFIMFIAKAIYRQNNDFALQQPAPEEQLQKCRALSQDKTIFENMQRKIDADFNRDNGLKKAYKVLHEIETYNKEISLILRHSSGFLTNEDFENFGNVLEVLREKNDDLKAKIGPHEPKGITNLGATCFMNSSLQTLFANDEFRKALKSENQAGIQDIKAVLNRQLGSVLHNDVPLYQNRNDIVDYYFREWDKIPLDELEHTSKNLNGLPLRKAFQIVIESGDQGDKLTRHIQRLFPLEATLIFDNEDIGWEQRRQILNALDINLQAYVRTRMVIETLREFLDTYETQNVKSSDFEEIAITLRRKLFDANLMEHGEDEEGLHWHQDAAPIFEFVLEALGFSIPLRERRIAELDGQRHVVEKIQPSALIQVPIEKEGSFQDLIDQYALEKKNSNVSAKGEVDRWKVTDEQDNILGEVDEWMQKEGIDGQPPRFIRIQLKRFVTEIINEKYVQNKISRPVDFEGLHYDLSGMFDLEDGQNALYKVKGCVIQSGSLRGGHYTSVIERKGQWYYCNDCSVAPLDDPRQDLSRGYIFLLEKLSDEEITRLPPLPIENNP